MAMMSSLSESPHLLLSAYLFNAYFLAYSAYTRQKPYSFNAVTTVSRFQYSNLIGCLHANYDVIVNILGVRYLENRRTRFRATAPLTALMFNESYYGLTTL